MTDTLHDSKIERLYLECVALNEDMGMYTESAGETIKKAFEKLKEFIQNIINKFKSAFMHVDANDISDNVEIDEENLSKTRKFLRAVKKLLGQSFEKLAAAIKNHKVIAGVSVAFVLGFTALTVVKTKTNNKINESNKEKVERNTARVMEVKKKVLGECINTYKDSIEEMNDCKKYASKLETLMSQTTDKRKKKVYQDSINDTNRRYEQLKNHVRNGSSIRLRRALKDSAENDFEYFDDPVTYAEIIHKFLMHITKTLNAIISKIAGVVKKKDN